MRTARVSIPVLVTLLTLGCGQAHEASTGTPATRPVQVEGRTIQLPPVPGMVWSGGERMNRKRYFDILGTCVPDTTWRRWEAQSDEPRARPRGAEDREYAHVYGTASADIGSSNTDLALARGEIVSRRNEAMSLGTHDPAQLAAWRGALRDGLAGRHAPLPAPVADYVVIEALVSSDTAFADVVALKNRTGLAASARMVVNERALDLDVFLRDPADCADIARVRSELLAWMDAVRAANAKK